MKALIDTNIIIDALQSREDFLVDAREIVLRTTEYDGYISASSITDIFYLQQRYFHDKKKARKNLAELLEIFNVLDTTAKDCRNALRSEISDFEDAVLVESALRSGLDCIITRNNKDFKNSKVKICSPTEFLEILEQESNLLEKRRI